ncbi:uncharacterized protein FOMMEDRAFT_25742 [Fomitiporia mediterranea MF3/22]|uniref:uncharacterized protein n=1 Tax=Fomitiporia mediterranea (strain MF3/22) TaxID=694068 RepID=UPI000440898F|nr:uncharacterized protein FOMMEDRAFT_25742 [Fomitiporia mediterranea MF3/22]EJD06470.1 hypothetical protein FOMMEDRAFT_25742 [Fomitiporia mediterranea MF3/22]
MPGLVFAHVCEGLHRGAQQYSFPSNVRAFWIDGINHEPTTHETSLLVAHDSQHMDFCGTKLSQFSLHPNCDAGSQESRGCGTDKHIKKTSHVRKIGYCSDTSPMLTYINNPRSARGSKGETHGRENFVWMHNWLQLTHLGTLAGALNPTHLLRAIVAKSFAQQSPRNRIKHGLDQAREVNALDPRRHTRQDNIKKRPIQCLMLIDAGHRPASTGKAFCMLARFEKKTSILRRQTKLRTNQTLCWHATIMHMGEDSVCMTVSERTEAWIKDACMAYENPVVVGKPFNCACVRVHGSRYWEVSRVSAKMVKSAKITARFPCYCALLRQQYFIKDICSLRNEISAEDGGKNGSRKHSRVNEEPLGEFWRLKECH